MYKPENRQRSFYDEVDEKALPTDHFLRRLEELIRWERLEKRLKPFYREAGRDAHNPVLMFKLLVLQFLYDLSDFASRRTPLLRLAVPLTAARRGLSPPTGATLPGKQKRRPAKGAAFAT